jgi:hypothetical protein
MTSLGYSPVPGDNSNQILQPTSLANPSSSNFADPIPQFSSKVEAVAGCPGAGGSAAALAGNSGYNVVKQSGGKSHRRGGSKKRSMHKSHKKGKKTHKRSCRCRRCCKRGKRSMRGGLLSLSPAPFSGSANLPQNQFMSNQPVSYNFGIGSPTPLPLNEIGTANNHMMDIHNNCGPDYGMVSKGLIL